MVKLFRITPSGCLIPASAESWNAGLLGSFQASMVPAVEPVLSKGVSFSFTPYIFYIHLYIFIYFKATGKSVLSDVISAHQV